MPDSKLKRVAKSIMAFYFKVEKVHRKEEVWKLAN